MQEIEYVEDLRDADERVLRAVHELSIVLEKEALPNDPPAPYEEFIADLQAQPSYVKPHYWLLWGDDGALAGSAKFRARYREDNRHIGRVSVELHPKHRGKGVAPGLLMPAAEAATADGRTLIQGYTYEGGPGERFAEKLGAKLAIAEAHNRLTLADVDRPMLEEWVAKARERASDYSLTFWEGPCPEDWVERYAELKHVMNTAPMPESMEDEVFTPEMLAEKDALTQEAGWVPWNYVAVHEPTEEWGGYTRLFPGVFRPQFAYQDDTGVRPEHRNRGLGRWLKATMLLKLMDERPQTRWVDTWNATVNEPMLNINHAMGFRRILKYQEWEIPSEELLAVLRNRA